MLVVLVGILFKENQTVPSITYHPVFANSLFENILLLRLICLGSDYIPYQQVNQNFFDAAKAMWNTLTLPSVWRPCLYMYLSLALSLDIYEGMFYWVTDSKNGPNFSKVISNPSSFSLR